jgi:glycosyltransferase involved in cell wall biosynthesis
MNPKKVIFLTISEPGYSRSWTYFNGARKLGENVEFIKIESNHLVKQFFMLREKFSKEDAFVVMSPSQYLVPFVRIFLGRTIILDAGWSLFEATVIARNRYGFFGLGALKTYLIDFISSQIATKVVLESKNQAEYYSRIFKINRKKIEVLYTGVDENSFRNLNCQISLPDAYNSKIVLFRGKYNKEAGIEVIAAATNLLISEDVTFWIFCPGLPAQIEFSKNTYICRNYVINQSEIINIYKHAQITLGQMSNHSRLSRTIPHKAFESAYLSKPYITAGNSGIREVFAESREIICTQANDPQDLALKIKYLIDNPREANSIGENMNLKYRNFFSQDILAKQFLRIVLEFN